MSRKPFLNKPRALTITFNDNEYNELKAKAVKNHTSVAAIVRLEIKKKHWWQK